MAYRLICAARSGLPASSASMACSCGCSSMFRRRKQTFAMFSTTRSVGYWNMFWAFARSMMSLSDTPCSRRLATLRISDNRNCSRVSDPPLAGGLTAMRRKGVEQEADSDRAFACDLTSTGESFRS